MESFIRTPGHNVSTLSVSRMEPGFSSLIEAFEAIDEYLATSRIEFDLFHFSEKPTLNSLVALLNKLCKSIHTQLVYFSASSFDIVAAKLNQLFTFFSLDFHVNKNDFQNLTNTGCLEMIMRPLAHLVKFRFEPIYRLLEKHKMEQHCKPEMDFRFEDIFNGGQRPIELFVKLRAGNISIGSFKDYVDCEMQRKHDSVESEIERIKCEQRRKIEQIKVTKTCVCAVLFRFSLFEIIGCGTIHRQC